MTIKTLGTLSTTSLNAVTYQSGVLSAADIASISAGILNDTYAKVTGGGGVITTGTIATSTALTALGTTTRVKAGMFVLGAGIPPGTFLVSVNTGASSAVMSQAATASASGVNLLIVPADYGLSGAFNASGHLEIPRRGVLKVFQGDVVAIDNSGWPILISAASIALTGSRWSLSA